MYGNNLYCKAPFVGCSAAEWVYERGYCLLYCADSIQGQKLVLILLCRQRSRGNSSDEEEGVGGPLQVLCPAFAAARRGRRGEQREGEEEGVGGPLQETAHEMGAAKVWVELEEENMGGRQ
ncbi:hypothetical protein L7F22_051129 [Adiantum nelumboides]|nr:hypothetical protein [Adiantum nelumboides]